MKNLEIEMQDMRERLDDLQARLGMVDWQFQEINSRHPEPELHEDAGGGGGSDLADYDPDAEANGTLTLAKPIYMAWWDGDEGASGDYEELLVAADTAYTGSGNYLCVKLDLTQSYGNRWSVARYTTNKVSASDDDAKYWCLGKIVDDVFQEWTFVIEHMGG